MTVVHLRMHSEFSIREGMVRVAEAVAQAAAFSMPALALSDVMNVFGLVKFYKAAMAAGIKPIAAVDARVADPADPTNPEAAASLLLVVQNKKGYENLCALISRAWLENQHRGVALLRREWLDRAQCEGLIALSGGAQGVLGPALRRGDEKRASQEAAEWASLFPGDRFCIEIQRAGFAGEEEYLGAAVTLASTLGLPVVATHPIQFLRREDFQAHEVRFCIAEGFMLHDPKRPRPFSEEQYFLSPQEMEARFADLPEALENGVAIAERANFLFSFGKTALPAFPTPDGSSVETFFVAQAEAGLRRRLETLFPEERVRAQRAPEYEARLRFECETIVKMGFAGYFLIVADFINWAKANGVPVGPGRGSGAGSLAAFALGITELDPLAYGLLFERFLNPERVSLPDFDVDFCMEQRYRVIEYVRERYGREAVSQIATFGTMMSKAVVRDVGRVLGLPYGLCDKIAKLIPTEGARPVSLAEAIELEPQLREFMNDPQDGEAVQMLFELAKPLEGLVRTVGMHAGGVLIAPGKITDFCPLFMQEGEDAVPVSQFDKDDVEAIGLVKFDFLGLRNLTIIREALDHVARMGGNRPDWSQMRFDDPAVFQLLREGKTTAVFQLESEGMKRLLAKLKPDRFEDIIAALALYRPGPLGSGMVDDFVLRKHGRQEIDYFHPDLRRCLEPTYGVIVYQEQVMEIARIIAGYSLGAADLLRRAMGKKKPEEMAQQRAGFVQGAVARGYDEALAVRLFDLMEKFAEYGFNKSHTAAYAVITYQTAWLKRHHPAAFFAATMSSEMNDTDALRVLCEDAREFGLEVLPPDVNASEWRFVPLNATTIRYGLGGIKGVGEPAAQAIVSARAEGGPFRDLFDLAARVDRRLVNRRVLEQLVRAGALDGLPGHARVVDGEGAVDRARLLASVETALQAAEQRMASAAQGGLFEGWAEERRSLEEEVGFAEVPPWTSAERLREEKAALGFFFSGHPFSAFERELRQTIPTHLASLSELNRDGVWVAGVVGGVRTRWGARGRVGFVTLEDGSATVEVLFFSEVFERARRVIAVDAPLVVRVRVQPDDYGGGVRVVAEEALSLEEWRARRLQVVEVEVPTTVLERASTAEEVVAAIEAFRTGKREEGAALAVWVRKEGAGRVALRSEEPLWVRPSDELLKRLRATPGVEVRWRY
ncbi:MAG: DNA polymerase III subunit alpha [Hydrogenophilus sp.]|nr:DNA polymerase III subunit alpha [Hydrogenophilus sp.]